MGTGFAVAILILLNIHGINIKRTSDRDIGYSPRRRGCRLPSFSKLGGWPEPKVKRESLEVRGGP